MKTLLNVQNYKSAFNYVKHIKMSTRKLNPFPLVFLKFVRKPRFVSI